MFNKKFVDIVLAMGLILSIDGVISQSQQQVSAIDAYELNQWTLTVPTTQAPATINCYSNNSLILDMKFLEDGAPIKPNEFQSSGLWTLYYPYSRYNDILAMLEKGNLSFYRNITSPESAFIQLKIGNISKECSVDSDCSGGKCISGICDLAPLIDHNYFGTYGFCPGGWGLVECHVTDDFGVSSVKVNGANMTLYRGDIKDGVWRCWIDGTGTVYGDCMNFTFDAIDTAGNTATLSGLFSQCWVFSPPGCYDHPV